MGMEREFRYNELVFLNQLQTRYQLFTSRVMQGLYAVNQEGIFLAKRGKTAKQRFLGKGGDIVVAEKVADWGEVKSVIVMNVRQENVANRPSLTLNILSPVYKEIGDWRVILKDGREIVIPNVDDPYNKLNYVKTRFNLMF
ncbi:hypothetical protein [Sulfolobus acidocaldarius]|uniref:Conserved conjugative plasmid protein n=4 Tax=Sulfolobus acidocaldarius TaxID=2285 RepID=Q4JBB3_SULAC|nr:hypothetical protein [Sulfolobus acidocaldarius]AAY79916.1 conserved conjugative plasmid protein [Sulfolobus acidocaldarius DSM 639]AGE70481.1 conjugative plasmid protein [Sulfolobus acidocaldarius N8]AGE72754.1 conjugative plasmid protein [Sulfolobus acidocaldarius Ron12/I]ALU29144.1 conjugal transfer protein [Sulfolobus acidocaldarius]ALU31870.1 conjugal transfer protein [Sulfolobus acidocaldarius]